MGHAAMSEPALVKKTTSLRVNNFDLIRLLAATQVLISHLFMTFFDAPSATDGGFGYFIFFICINLPGVPIFFAISGYLISLSWERSGSLSTYAHNRFLRLFPALWLCLIVTILVMLASGYLASVEFDVQDFLRWIFWQSTIGQTYTIGMLHGFGHGGAPNGALWSIPVEMQFYVALPLIYLVLPKKSPRLFIVGIALLVLVMAVVSEWLVGQDITTKWGFRLRVVTCLPYIYMFLLGVLIQRLRHQLMPLLRNMLIPWLAFYIGVASLLHFEYGWPLHVRLGSNNPPIFLAMILAMTTISAAYTLPTLSKKILRGNDISYGVYIYHMVFINLVLYLEIAGAALQAIIVVLATYTAATLSWLFLERPSLSLKRHTLRTDGPTTAAKGTVGS